MALNNDVNVTKKIFEEFETQQAHQQTKSDIEDFEGLDPKEYSRLYDKATSKGEEIERQLEADLNQLSNYAGEVQELRQNEIAEARQEDSFVEVETVETILDAFTLAMDCVKRDTLARHLYFTMMQEQNAMIDIQQLAHDEGRVKELMENIEDFTEDKMDRALDTHEDFVESEKQAIQKIANAVKSNQNSTEEFSQEAIDQLSTVADQMEKLMQQMNSGNMQSGQMQQPQQQRPRQQQNLQQNQMQNGQRQQPQGNSYQNNQQQNPQSNRQVNNSQQPQQQNGFNRQNNPNQGPGSSPQAAAQAAAGSTGENSEDSGESADLKNDFSSLSETQEELVKVYREHSDTDTTLTKFGELLAERVDGREEAFSESTIETYLKRLGQEGYVEY